MPDSVDIVALRDKLADAKGIDRVLVLAELALKLTRNDLTEARALADEAVSLARQFLDKPSKVRDTTKKQFAMATALQALGGCCITGRHISEAKPVLTEALAMFKETASWQHAIDAARELATVYRDLDLNSESTELLEEALELCNRHSFTKNVAMLYAELALSHQSNQEEQATLAALEKAREMIDQTDDFSQRTHVLHSMATVYANLGEFATAIETFEQLIPQLREAGATYNLLAVIHNYGLSLLAVNEHERALQAAEEKAALAREAGYEYVEASALHQIGEIYTHYGEYDRAVPMLEQSADIFRKLKDKSSMLSVLAHLGGVHIDMEDRARGYELLAEVSDLLQELGRNINHFNAVKVLVYHTPDNCSLNDLLEYLEADKNEFHTPGMSKPVRISLLLGSVYEKLGHSESARAEFQEALSLSRKLENVCLQAETLQFLGAFESRAGNVESARKHLRNALFLGSDCHNWMVRRGIHEALSDHYERVGELKLALEQHKEIVHLEKEVLFDKTPRRVERLIAESNVERLEFKVKNLQEKIETLEAQIDTERKSNELIGARNARSEELLSQIKAVLRRAASQSDDDFTREIQSALDLIAGSRKKSSAAAESDAEQVDQDFIKRLKEKYPKLTPKELKVCSLLRLNMSTKDLARYLSVSPRAIETYRYRIRRKLQLGTGVDLTVAIKGILND